jgi:hypothetical protein
MSADASPTLAMIAYAPLIWDPVLLDHPRDAPGYDWREHFRDLCARARKVWRAAPIELRVCGEAERRFIAALADLARDPGKGEAMIAWRAAQGRPGREQLDFADPHDEHLKPEPAHGRPIGRKPPS